MSSQPDDVLPKGLAVQMPSQKYLNKMRGMPAAWKDDQKSRLKKVKKTVKKAAIAYDFISADTPKKYDHENINIATWKALFKLISQGKHLDAVEYFKTRMTKDTLYQALLTAHNQDYIEELITYCCKAKIKALSLSDGDILITNATFEILIMDLIAVITNRHQMTFSCGLPTHHASQNKGSGFCSLNKLAVLMAYDHLLDKRALHPLVIGTDVNQDNGLHDILFNKFGRTFKTTHIDIFDSRVYPWPEMQGYEESSRYDITEKKHQTRSGYKTYHAINLADNPRPSPEAIHPVINYLMLNTMTQIYEAKEQHKKLALYLPLGWDSHQGEIAPCGAEVKINKLSRALSEEETLNMRFNDNDMRELYCFFQLLIETHADDIHSITLFLEGGYTDKILLAQIPQLITTLASQKQLNVSNSHSTQFSAPKKHSYSLRKRTIETTQETDQASTNNANKRAK
jgi:acetoin utilization deacetylase AcuC-like enzyme